MHAGQHTPPHAAPIRCGAGASTAAELDEAIRAAADAAAAQVGDGADLAVVFVSAAYGAAIRPAMEGLGEDVMMAHGGAPQRGRGAQPPLLFAQQDGGLPSVDSADEGLGEQAAPRAGSEDAAGSGARGRRRPRRGSRQRRGRPHWRVAGT